MRLSEEQIAAELATLRWHRRGNTIVRDWMLEDFRAAIAFVDRIAELAEAAGHHPDILLHRHKHVRVTLTTHSMGGLTPRDFELARRIDEIA